MKVKIFVGTCGWYYDWNEGRSLDWYVKNSGLNAVELNASFYRFPFPNQIKGWVRKGKDLRWSIKVNRLVTHQYKFDKRALESWKKFKKLFEPLDKFVDFYLFQLPPSYKASNFHDLEKFVRKTKLGKRFALECRSEEWFSKEYVKWAKEIGITFVSVDAPKFSRDIFNTSGLVYERIHGRSGWYSHDYSRKELKEIAEKIFNVRPRAKKVYVFFNNNHAMLSNARSMLKIMRNWK